MNPIDKIQNDTMGIIIQPVDWGSYPDDERSEIIKKITARAMGKMTDEEWISFKSCLDRVAEMSKG